MRRDLIPLLLLVAAANVIAQIPLEVPSQFPTIQSAILGALPGDTVVVGPGVYFENIDFLGKNIVVASIGGSASTIIDGGGSGRVVYFGNGENQNAQLIGFTITHGHAAYTGVGYSDVGGGISCWFSSPTITNCVITGNTAENAGGGIACFVASPTVTSCLVVGNSAGVGILSGGGGNIWVQDASAPVFDNCLIASGTSYAGGGIALYAGAFASVTNCTIVANLAHEGGGISVVWGSTLDLRNSILWSNEPSMITTAFAAGPGVVIADHCDLQAPATTMTACFSLNPLFMMNGPAYRLSAASPCVDTGSMALASAAATDFEGEPRIDGAGIDIGCDEFYAFGLCGAGNVGLGQGGPFGLLTVNASIGLPSRIVSVPISGSITIAVAQPPTNPLPAPFVIYGVIGTSGAADGFELPFNLGAMCFTPFTANPLYPGAFILANSYYALDPDALLPSTPAPWTFTKVTGIHFPFQFTLQGLISQDPATVRVTNGVILNIQ